MFTVYLQHNTGWRVTLTTQITAESEAEFVCKQLNDKPAIAGASIPLDKQQYVAKYEKGRYQTED